MDILDNQYAKESTPGRDGLRVTRNMKINWLTTSKWVIFLSVLGFIFTALSLGITFFMMPMIRMALAMSGQSMLADMIESIGTAYIVFMLLMSAVAFFIYFFQLRFATGIQRAMRYDSQDSFEFAWRNLRNHLRLAGIVTIVMIALYIVMLVFLGSMAASQPDF